MIIIGAYILILTLALILAIKKIRKKYPSEPPLRLLQIIETENVPGTDSPITRFIKETHDRTNTEMGGIWDILLIEFNLGNETLGLFRNSCHPSDDVGALSYYWYEWPKWWQRMALPAHPYNHVHYMFPSSWLHEGIPCVDVRA